MKTGHGHVVLMSALLALAPAASMAEPASIPDATLALSGSGHEPGDAMVDRNVCQKPTPLATLLQAPEPPGSLSCHAVSPLMLDDGELLPLQRGRKRAPRRGKRQPPRRDCTAHLTRCLETRLGAANSGGRSGHSICADCHEVCRGQKKWPDFNRTKKDCRWWNYPAGRR